MTFHCLKPSWLLVDVRIKVERLTVTMGSFKSDPLCQSPNSPLANLQNILNAPGAPGHLQFPRWVVLSTLPFLCVEAAPTPSLLPQITPTHASSRPSFSLRKTFSCHPFSSPTQGAHKTVCCDVLLHRRDCVLLCVCHTPVTPPGTQHVLSNFALFQNPVRWFLVLNIWFFDNLLPLLSLGFMF